MINDVLHFQVTILDLFYVQTLNFENEKSLAINLWRAIQGK